MSTLTIRLTEEKHARLRQLAESQGVSMNRLIDELATVALVHHDAEVRFRLRASRGNAGEGLKVLDRLEKHFRQQQ